MVLGGGIGESKALPRADANFVSAPIREKISRNHKNSRRATIHHLVISRCYDGGRGGAGGGGGGWQARIPATPDAATAHDQKCRNYNGDDRRDNGRNNPPPAPSSPKPNRRRSLRVPGAVFRIEDNLDPPPHILPLRA